MLTPGRARHAFRWAHVAERRASRHPRDARRIAGATPLDRAHRPRRLRRDSDRRRERLPGTARALAEWPAPRVDRVEPPRHALGPRPSCAWGGSKPGSSSNGRRSPERAARRCSPCGSTMTICCTPTTRPAAGTSGASICPPTSSVTPSLRRMPTPADPCGCSARAGSRASMTAASSPSARTATTSSS